MKVIKINTEKSDFYMQWFGGGRFSFGRYMTREGQKVIVQGDYNGCERNILFENCAVIG